MLERLRTHLDRNGLIPNGSKVLVGYSGGADSTCLLHLLSQFGVELIAAHLHHGQRPEGDEELERCEQFATALKIPFISGRAEVPMMAKEFGIGLEEAGRRARYAFFEQAARHYDCSKVATAHTRTDHVETVIHHLIRGCGLSGLSGIPAERGQIVRPLLIFDREETRGYCDERGLWYHDDPANADVSLSRARIRHRILPEMRAINESAMETIARTAGIVASEDRFLNGMAAAALERCEAPLNGELEFLTKDIEIAFEKNSLTQLPEVLFKRAVRLATEALGGELDSRQTDAVLDGMVRQPRGSVTSVGGLVAITWTPERIQFEHRQEMAPFRFRLTLPGETECDLLGWRVVAFHGASGSGLQKRGDLAVEVDSQAIKGELFVRSFQAADKMQPLGFEGKRKISDLLGEAKLTAAARARLPIVCDLLGPIWIPGVCLDNRARVLAGSKTVTALRFESSDSYASHNEETGISR